MILSDYGIRNWIGKGELLISPIEKNQIQPASVDLRLNSKLLTLDGDKIDISKEDYMLQPKEFILGSTLEKVEIGDRLVGVVDGRSSIGRLGVMVHVTAGYIDPGFKGNITLELYNVSNKPFKLKYKDSICQLRLHLLKGLCMRPYGSDELGSKYQNSDGVIASKYEG